jgi:hypothetical protein
VAEEHMPKHRKQLRKATVIDSVAIWDPSKQIPDEQLTAERGPVPGADLKASGGEAAAMSETLSESKLPIPDEGSVSLQETKKEAPRDLTARVQLPAQTAPGKPESGGMGRPEQFSGSVKSSVSLDTRTDARGESQLRVRVYAQDPSFKGTDGKPVLCDYFPGGRCLGNGPTDPRIAVVDFDRRTRQTAPPAVWNEEKRCFGFRPGGDGPWTPFNEEDHRELPQYHQLNVWAVIQHVLEIYEGGFVLGRSTPWAFEGNRLIVVPHAGHLENAFYDRRSKSIQFYSLDGQGGEQVHTCLSHDIIAHETGHAILDGMRPLYDEDTSLQTTAFHEFVADLTAILASLLNGELRQMIAEDSGGKLAQAKFLSGLAEEFSLSTTGSPYLRNALNAARMTDGRVAQSHSPHDVSEVLTGAMFDILVNISARYMPEEITKKKKKKKTLAPDHSLTDEEKQARDGSLARIESALYEASLHFLRVALPPLDYLPPVDVQFEDYARAVLRAHEVADPADRNRFRKMIREVFAWRGIDVPAEEPPSRTRFRSLDIDRLSLSRTDAYLFLNENRSLLRIPDSQDISVADLYQTDKTDAYMNKLPREIVLQYTWREDVELKGPDFGALDGRTAALLCGGTLVFDGRGNLLHWTRKPGTGDQPFDARTDQEQGNQRKGKLLEYIKHRVALGRIELIEH